MENFEKIFKEKLEKHNGKVRAGAWAGVSAGVAGKAATGSSLFTGGAMTYVASIAATALVAISSIAIWSYATEEEPKKEITEIIQPTIEEDTDETAVQNLSDIIDSQENYVITEDDNDHEVKVTAVKKNQLYTKLVTSPSGGFAPLKIYFSHETSSGATIHWNFGDGTESYVNAPSHRYKKPGTYKVVLSAKDKKGNVVKEETTIEVKESSYIMDATKVITPNNDGVNDVFRVESKNLTEYELIIFNRFGEFVFETTNPNDSWSGLNTNKEKLSVGTYLYTIKAKGVDGKEYNFNGRIELK